MKIAIIGAGAFGTALGGILEAKGYDIDYYDPIFERGLNEVIFGANFIILVAPSIAVPVLLATLPKEVPLIIATKGLLGDAIFNDFGDYMVLSGPGFADDLKAHKHTRLTATDRRIVDLFSTEYLDFDFTTDRRGVLMCGALKNVYAILAGVLDLKNGTYEFDKFINDATDEMKNVLVINGADPATVDLSCGKEDLKLTCNYPSRNYEFGQKVRHNFNYKPEKTVEGLATLNSIKCGEISIPDTAELLRRIIGFSGKWH